MYIFQPYQVRDTTKLCGLCQASPNEKTDLLFVILLFGIVYITENYGLGSISSLRLCGFGYMIYLFFIRIRWVLIRSLVLCWVRIIIWIYYFTTTITTTETTNNITTNNNHYHKQHHESVDIFSTVPSAGHNQVVWPLPSKPKRNDWLIICIRWYILVIVSIGYGRL